MKLRREDFPLPDSAWMQRRQPRRNIKDGSSQIWEELIFSVCSIPENTRGRRLLMVIVSNMKMRFCCGRWFGTLGVPPYNIFDYLLDITCLLSRPHCSRSPLWRMNRLLPCRHHRLMCRCHRNSCLRKDWGSCFQVRPRFFRSAQRF